MKCSVVLATISLALTSGLTPPGRTLSISRSILSLKMASERITSAEAMADFSHDFQAGLKFILVPQYELKEKAREAARLKEALESAPASDASSISAPTADVFAAYDATIDSVDKLTVLDQLNMESVSNEVAKIAEGFSLPTYDMSVPDINILRESVSNEVAKIAEGFSLPTYAMSVPDINILRETLTNAFPTRTTLEISDITARLAEITSSVQERTQQFSNLDNLADFSKSIPDFVGIINSMDFLDELKKETPDISGFLGEQYQKMLTDITYSDLVPSVVLSDLKERVSSIEFQEFQTRSIDLDKMFVPSVPVEKFDAVFDSLNELVQTGGWTLPDLLEALNFNELGGWYSGTIVGIFLVAASLAKSKTPVEPYVPYPRKQLVKRTIPPKKISTPRPTARVQGFGAGIFAAQVPDDKMRLENLVSDLTIAVTTLSKELSEMKMDKAQTEYALATMKSDVRTLQNAMDANSQSELQLEQQVEESLIMERNLQSRLTVAETRVKALELEKQSLSSEIYGLKGKKPMPPDAPPAKSLLTRSAEKIWFANIVVV